MYIDKVNISETYEIYNGEKILRWKKIEANVNLSQGEDSMQGAEYVQDFINEWNNRNNVRQYPLSESECISANPIPQQVSTKPTKEQVFIETINTYTDPVALEKNMKGLAKNYPSIKYALEKKLSELQNK